MTTYISLLRGINVSGQKKIQMAELRNLYESLGVKNVQSYLQSGNVVFDSDEQDATELGKSIEAQIDQNFGFFVPVLMRTANGFQRIIENHPFAGEEAIRVLVTFLYNYPDKTRLEELRKYEDKVDQFAIGELEIFLFCPDGYGKTKLSNTFFEKKLNVAATTRNWKSVNALYQMARER